MYLIVVADDSINNKYGGNRNSWRRVYPRARRKPVVETFIEALTAVTFSYDLNKTYRHRDFFIIKSPTSGSFGTPIVLAEYDEGLINFENTDFQIQGFTSCFSNIPDAVVLTVEPVSDFSNNIIPYGISFTSCSMSIGLSAKFSGSIRYRAIYSSTGYPAFATSSFAPSSGVFTVIAGHVTASNTDNFTVPHDFGGPSPNAVRMTTWDDFVNYDVDVYIGKSVGVTGSDVNLSAPIDNILYYIAFA